MRSEGKPNVAHDDDGVIDGDFEEVPNATTALQTVRRNSGALQVKTAYATAVHVQIPRDLASGRPSSVLARVLREAEICGEDFIYSMTFRTKEGPSVVEGVSIDGAMIMARNYGNCATDVEIVEEGPAHWVMRAVFIDLETGFTEPRLFRQSKGTVQGKFDAERKLDMAFQICQSKAKRNVIVRAMPAWLVAKAVDAAKASAAAKIKDLPGEIDRALKAFGDLGVDQARMEKRIGAPIAQWNARDVVKLKATYRAVKDRQTTAENEFPAVEAVPNQPPAATSQPSTGPSAPTQPAPEEKPAEKPAEPPPAQSPPPVAPTPNVPQPGNPPAPNAPPDAPPPTPQSPTQGTLPTAASTGKSKTAKRDREPGEDDE